MAPIKKDFSSISTTPVYSAIAEATAQEEKGRKTYTEAERLEFLEACNTSGRKGCHMPRMNIAFSPSHYSYIKTMAQVSGLTLTDFVNLIIQQHLEAHLDQYEKALEFRRNL